MKKLGQEKGMCISKEFGTIIDNKWNLKSGQNGNKEQKAKEKRSEVNIDVQRNKKKEKRIKCKLVDLQIN